MEVVVGKWREEAKVVEGLGVRLGGEARSSEVIRMHGVVTGWTLPMTHLPYFFSFSHLPCCLMLCEPVFELQPIVFKSLEGQKKQRKACCDAGP